jgi:hypothetical protein
MKTDAEIQQDVLHELSWEPEIDIADVGVRGVTNLLKATAPAPEPNDVRHQAERTAVLNAARATPGVKEVEAQIRVTVAR